MNDQEIYQLAQDIIAGKVFGSWQIEDSSMLQSIFMALMFCEPETIDKDTTAIYEYLDQAGALAVNGYPTFLSMRLLRRDDQAKLSEKVKQIQKAIESVAPEPQAGQ